MILLIDSGSTKSDWLFVDNNGTFMDSYKTMGFNPFFHSSAFIESEIRKEQSLMGIAGRVEKIYYYGAGCSNEAYKKTVRDALLAVFPASHVHVDHDMMAACYATYEGTPCISCILGTGSNAAYFDGKELYSVNSGLGYILGDEGSGSYFGKKLLAAFLYKQLPEEISRDLEDEFGLSRASIFKHVYGMPHANVYLAGYTRFIARHQDHPYMEKMLFEGMKEFLSLHVCCFPDYRDTPTHFVGSIAFYFSEPIRKAAAELEVNMGQVIKSPIQKLLEYHIRNVFEHA